MNQKNSQTIITRFAPSPTGFLHVGSARTALYAYLWAKKNSGQFILRIEDTDKSREVPGSITHLQESLRWLGIDWDYGPDKPGPFGSCIQSERLPLYIKYAKQLLEKGLAYPDPYSNEEVQEFRKQATDNKEPFLFRNHRPEKILPWDGTKPLRLRVPEIKRYNWNDVVRGPLSAGEEMLDDFIIIKSDGYPTYNFAHIIDDLEMGVTHIMRADEFISSTPKFLSLYDALEIPYPAFVTLPPILRDDRTKKLGKRDGAKDILDYRQEGFLPSALVNFLAFIGWNPGTDQEVFTMTQLIEAFGIEKIQHGGAAFNEEKLLWVNKQHINLLSLTEKTEYVKNALPDSLKNLPTYTDDKMEKLVPVICERIQVSSEITTAANLGEYDFAFIAPKNFDVKLLCWKNEPSLEVTKNRLMMVKENLSPEVFATSEDIKAAIWPLTETEGRGEVLWPLRVALSGQERSPDPFTIAWIIGYQETINRILLACDKIGK